MKTRNEFTQVENDHIAAEDRLRNEQDAAEKAAAEDRQYPAKIEPRSEPYKLCASAGVNPRKRYSNGETAEYLASMFMLAADSTLKGIHHLVADQNEDAEKIAEKLRSLFKSKLIFQYTEVYMYHDFLLNFAIILKK